MKNKEEILDNLKMQSKQAEATFLKIQGAIEIITSMIEEDEKEQKKTAKAQEQRKK
jgi:hypothetical protein